MEEAILKAFQVEPRSVERLVDFLPYPFLIGTKKADGVFSRLVNKRFQEEIGYNLDEIATIDDWFAAAYPDEAYRHAVSKLWRQNVSDARARGKDSVVQRVRIFTRPHGYQWYEVKSSLTDTFEFVAFVNVNDVIERDLELERSNENKNRVLSILGHDLRTPLMQLIKLTEFMLTSNFSAPDFITHVGKVQELSKLSLQFLETTLVWSRDNFERVTPRRERILLRGWLEKLVELYSTAAALRNIDLVLDVHPAQHVFSDPVILHIVVRNLLTNAIKFSNENSTVHIRVEDLPDARILSVTDKGRGMSTEVVKAILADQFDAGHAASIHGGFGLGLRLCKEVLKGIGGELTIDSMLNEGTTVSVALPLVTE